MTREEFDKISLNLITLRNNFTDTLDWEGIEIVNLLIEDVWNTFHKEQK